MCNSCQLARPGQIPRPGLKPRPPKPPKPQGVESDPED